MSSFCRSCTHSLLYFFFFFNDTATTEIYTLSLHDALPISSFDGRIITVGPTARAAAGRRAEVVRLNGIAWQWEDRKSTRLNSSHLVISYAVFCLKKKKIQSHYNSHCLIELL